MTFDLLLFILRLLSGLLLLMIMGAFFVVIWREYTVIKHSRIQSQRIYGQLKSLKRMDDFFLETEDNYPLYTITTIGRAPTNTIILDNTFASSEHAVLALRDGQWWLEDRQSRNGTLLNDEKITTPTIVTEGDIINIGDHNFKLILQDSNTADL